MGYNSLKAKALDIEAKQERDFRRTILLVDDEPVNLRILGNMLGDDYDVIYAQSGSEALNIINAQGEFLSLILLDLYMPEMHGYEVIDELSKDDKLKKIPIIVFTSDNQAEVESLQRGAIDFLHKPYERPEVIRARIKRAIELSIDRKIIDSTGVDELTGLLTKRYFFQYAREYDKFHSGQAVDAVVVNYSKFHLLNELYGRQFGDKVLCAMGDGIREVARACGGVASRCDADLFYLYIEHQESYDYLADKICDHLSSIVDRTEIKVRIGVYQDVYHTASLEQRFDRALQACNTISRSDRSANYAIYDNKMHEKELFEARLLEDIGKALDERQFSIVFQPKYDIRGDEPKLCSAEVLIRWKHPQYGDIMPDSFIPLFEENGLINGLDRFVWTEAARQIRLWKDMYGVVMPLSVNVSRVDTYDPDLIEFLKKLVDDNGLETKDIRLEITETAYTEKNTRILEVVRELQNAGFLVEMDDFGKGYSSLNMLTALPIDALKLDMAFIRNIAENSRELSIVEFILDIARFLEVPVIAEGVETAEQYLLLKKAGCDIIQGFYFSKPVTASEFGYLIEKNMNV